jgi:transcriptional antiterminator NusG
MSNEEQDATAVAEEDASESTEKDDGESSTSPEEKADWFVLHTFAGQEETVQQRIEDMVETEGLHDIVFDVVVPTQEVMEIRNGEKQEVEKQLYPGYIFIKMVMSDENWHTIRQTNGVTGFVGTQMNPIPVRDTEMGEVLSQIGEGDSEPQVEFSVDDTVRIISGAMEEMTGTVTDVDIDKAKLHVSVDMFGRSTPVELDFDQAEKL